MRRTTRLSDSTTRRYTSRPHIHNGRLKEEGTLRLLEGEYDDLIGHADRAFGFRTAATAAEGIAATLAAIPSINVLAAYWGVGTQMKISGGEILCQYWQSNQFGLEYRGYERGLARTVRFQEQPPTSVAPTTGSFKATWRPAS